MSSAVRKIVEVLFAVLVFVLLMLVVDRSEAAVRHVDYVVDGDTVRLGNGQYVRLLGIDTPERGECGYRRAKNKLDDWVGGRVRLVNPASVDNVDHYGRLIRYVHDSGRDTGLALIRRGLAKARYDSLDGYDRHPRQATYRRADRNNPDVC
jgi:endonuclease YncB( thermonuclease family)